MLYKGYFSKGKATYLGVKYHQCNFQEVHQAIAEQDAEIKLCRPSLVHGGLGTWQENFQDSSYLLIISHNHTQFRTNYLIERMLSEL